ncbi:MAG: heme biosynthesis HemY N-terminal domain-containing protein [Burkholderiales bacterium]
MRVALWLLALFVTAVALALFVGDNPGTVTLFWPPWRIDLSLNLVLLGLGLLFVSVYVALRALALLFDLPRQAQQWRVQQKERAMYGALLDALSQLLAGRFIRARTSALQAIAQEKALAASAQSPDNALQLRALAHVLVAEAAQSLQDPEARQTHLAMAQDATAQRQLLRHSPETQEGTQLRAARWALEDQDPQAALALLDTLPTGAARRTLALRLKLKAARQARQTELALDTARVLARHRAFSQAAAQGIVRSLASELLHSAHDLAQLQHAWQMLTPPERAMPVLVIAAAERLQALQGDAQQVRTWLMPAWESSLARPSTLTDQQRLRLVRLLQNDLDSLDGPWLARIEAAQKSNPRDANLHYLAGMAFKHRQLWGKAQQLLVQATQGLQDVGLLRMAWRALGELAEQRDDAAMAADCYRRSAQL